MKFRILVSMCMIVAMPSLAAADGPPYNLTVAGGSAAGLLTTLNAGVDKAVSTTFPGSTITYETTGGGLANIALVDRKRVPLGYITDAELTLAVEGRKPFNHKIESLRKIASVAGWVPMQYVVTRSFAEKYGLKSLKDIARVKPPIRIGLQQRGNVVSTVSEDMFKELGVTPKDIVSWGGQVIYIGGSEFAPLMGDGRLDMMFNATPVKGRVATAVERAADVVMLDVDKKVVDSVAKKWGLALFDIPKGTYAWQNFDLHTLSFGIVLVANKDMPDKTAYDLTKALVEHVALVKSVHPFLRPLTKEFYVSNTVGKFHPGAVRYYKEVGLMK